jgi:hypothetical protein
LIADLSAEDVETQQAAAVQAAAFVPWNTYHFLHPEQTAESYQLQMGAALFRVRPTPDDLDALAQALAAVLASPHKVAGTAAWALAPLMRLDLVPRLADMVRYWAPINGMDAKQGIYAMEDAIGAAFDRRMRGPRRDEWVLIRIGMAALRFADEHAVDDIGDAGEAAAQALRSNGWHRRWLRRRLAGHVRRRWIRQRKG